MFRGVYAAGVQVLEEASADSEDANPQAAAAAIRKYIRSLSARQVDQLFSRDLGENRLQVQSVGHRNPLEIFVASAAGGVLLAVVFLCGGKVKVGFGGIEFQCNGIGSLVDAIKKLNDLFAENRPIPLGYGTRLQVFKLSDDEYDELLRPEKGLGGFQSLIKKLRRQTNKRKIITLQPRDAERIRRYATEGSGGFQTRIRKIFGRHLNLD